MSRRRAFSPAGLVAVSSVISALTVIGVERLLRADDPKPTWKTTVLYEGTLTGATLPARLKFTFKKNGVACGNYEGDADVDASTHALRFPIVLGDPQLAGCGTLFDGSDVTYTVEVNKNVVLVDAAIVGVPYAQQAARAETAKVADVAGQYGSPDCPVGYTRLTLESKYVVCKRGVDEVVRVGVGGSAFWIDRFEASVWSGADGTGRKFGSADDYPEGFPKNGQWGTPGHASQQLFAISKGGEIPSTFITWFQALEACGASGKRLPTGDEWLRAAQGTDPVPLSDGADGHCISNAPRPDVTGARATRCSSYWGAMDMHGNVWEWTADWLAGLGDATPMLSWPSEYDSDGTWNIVSSAQHSDGKRIAGLPAAIARGGGFSDGRGAGIFALLAAYAPSSIGTNVGFRCVIPR